MEKLTLIHWKKSLVIGDGRPEIPACKHPWFFRLVKKALLDPDQVELSKGSPSVIPTIDKFLFCRYWFIKHFMFNNN